MMRWDNPVASRMAVDALHKQVAELQERIRLLEERQEVLDHPRCRGDHVSCKWPLVAALADAENAVVESAEKLGIKVDGMHEEAVKAYVGQVEERIRLLEAAWEAQEAYEQRGRLGNGDYNLDLKIAANKTRLAAGRKAAL